MYSGNRTSEIYTYLPHINRILVQVYDFHYDRRVYSALYLLGRKITGVHIILYSMYIIINLLASVKL